MICDYGCGQKAIHQFKNGKWCCENNWRKCTFQKTIISKKSKGKNNPMYGTCHTNHSKTKMSISQKNKGPCSLETKKKMSISQKRRWDKITYLEKRLIYQNRILTIENIIEKYYLFSKIEEMRYNPEKPDKKEIQGRCKNHKCPNSKEKDGWFTPTRIQLAERIRQLESPTGTGGSYFYCSAECKSQCPLYNLNSDIEAKMFLNDNLKLWYTQGELTIWGKFVLERENYICEYCGESAVHAHHERPKKLEPFFALDPDNGIAACVECHFKYGHPIHTFCSTGMLATTICSG